MAQKVSNPTPVAAGVVVSPLARFVRGAVQVVLAVAAAIPTILNTPGVSGNAVVAKYVTIIAGYVLVVNGLINTLEHFGVIPVMGGKAAPLAVPEG